MSDLDIDHLQEQTVKDDAKVYIIEIQIRRIRGKARFSFTGGGLAAFDLEEKPGELDEQLRDRFDLRYATEDPVTIGSLTENEEGEIVSLDIDSDMLQQ